MKDIIGWDGVYAADENGRIWVMRNGQQKVMKPYVNTGGYLRVNLWKNGKAQHKYVHRLVAQTFLPNPEDLPVANHIDANPANNEVSNLEWSSQQENIAHSRSLGNQHKDLPIAAVSVETGERREYPNMRTASTDLFGKYWRLVHSHQTKGARFQCGGWDFEVEQK